MLISGVLPSKKFFTNAIILLLIAGGWFVVAEVRRSRVSFEAPVALNTVVASDIITQEQANEYLDTLLRDTSRAIVESKKAESLEEYSVNSASEEEELFLIGHSDVLLAKKSDDEAIRAYGKAIGAILNPLFPADYEYEPDIYERFVSTQDASLAGVLETRRQAYLAAALTLTEVATPPSAAFISLSIANALIQMAGGLRDMQLAFSEPEKSVSGVVFFASRTQAFYDGIEDLNAYFRSRNISFATEEVGNN